MPRSYFASALGCRCPRCRQGKLFERSWRPFLKNSTAMQKKCMVCGQPTEIEVGFYYGTGYVSYALSVAISIISFGLWVLVVGISLNDNRFFFWLGFNALLLIFLQPLLMRLSRSIWISWFVSYDSEWGKNRPEEFTERLNADHANNW